MTIIRNVRVTIYRKMSALIVIFGLLFLFLCFSIYYYTLQQEQEVYQKTKKQFDQEVSSLIELESNTNISNIIDMVYWDDFVKFIKVKDNKWFKENIDSSVGTYQADYLGVYDVDGKFIGKSSTNKIQTPDFIPKEVFNKLRKDRLVSFYIRIPEGYAQVFGASIHPTVDIYKKVSKPEGFFFIIKLLDRDYFTNLERINNSDINLMVPGLDVGSNVIATSRKLKGYNGEVLNTIVFERPFDVSFDITKNILLILIGTFILSNFVFLFLSRKWIYKPLNLITSILERGSETDMQTLKDIPGEFRYIGTLFKENNDQKKLLEEAKAKAEESDRLKSSFLTNISHEIRTPMNAIAGFSDLLLNSELSDSERADYIKIINSSGKNLVSIIDDLIEMSKIDTNQVMPNYGSVEIDACLKELYQTIKISIPETKQIDFQIRKPVKGLKRKITTDVVKLKQILTNLITNAIKYTENGFVLFGYEVSADGTELQFIIQDSGIGIDEIHHQKIFDRFHRIENDYTIKAGGLGLGLAISKAYVQMLGGNISFESGELKGTTFTFTIPVRYTGVSDEVQAPVSKVENQREITILVAEDDNINFLLIQKILRMNQHVILRARDGQEAVDICAANPNIDLVLMDIKMPVLSGYQAFDQIKIIKPRLPVIAQTAYASAEDAKKILLFGFRGYISKPINKEKLFEIINEVMHSKYND